MPVSATRLRKRTISSGGSTRARHCPADLVKICSDSQRVATARSTARGSPPAIERWAPSRGMRSVAAEDVSAEARDQRPTLPRIGGEPGLHAGLAQELLRSPAPLRRD